MYQKPELLAPAGDWPSLTAALAAGADSVYFGVKGFNLRHFASNFELSELPKLLAEIHSRDKKGFLTLNTIVMDNELACVTKVLKVAKKAGVDAVLLWDMAVMRIAMDLGLKVHLSTQASVANFEAVKFYAGLGVQRVVLARECSLKNMGDIIKQLKKESLPCEIEVFVHGAMCVSVSGRCFLSQEAFGESANKGRCLQPCRREYIIKEKDGEQEFILGQDYVLSPRDLCSIEFVDKLIETGINSFKIEGRIRPPEYVMAVTGAYRKAIDACVSGAYTDAIKKVLSAEIGAVYNRGFSEGFYFDVPVDLGSSGPQTSGRKVYLGRVEKYYKSIAVAEIVVHDGTVAVGDRVLVIGKSTAPQWLDIGSMEKEHIVVNSAGKGENVAVKVPFSVKRGDKIFRWEE